MTLLVQLPKWGLKEIEELRCKNVLHIFHLYLEGGSPDERFKETPRAFPIKSNRRATFDTVPGSMSGFGGIKTRYRKHSKYNIVDPAREAASKRYEESKKAYASDAH